MAARSDKVADPVLAEELLMARRGQAYFSRKLNELTDEEFDAPSLLPGWGRRHVVAHVGLGARAFTRLTEWAATGTPTPVYVSLTERNEEIHFSATLPVGALRNLSAHAAVHLNVEWRDLESEAWSNPVRLPNGNVVPVSDTVWMRAREVWVHAADLGNGGTFEQFPAEVVDALIVDALGSWKTPGLDLPSVILKPTDREDSFSFEGSGQATLITGRAWQLAKWATGRGDEGVLGADGRPPMTAPRWR